MRTAIEPAGPVEGRDSPWGLVGGFRPLAADCFWLQADLAWERQDEAGTRYFLGLTLSTQPRSSYFWLNSARILAYDLPAWESQTGQGSQGWLRAYRQKSGAEEALALLEQARRLIPDSADLELEMGNICLYGLGDRARAAEHFRRLAGRRDAPAFAGRIYRRLCPAGW